MSLRRSREEGGLTAIRDRGASLPELARAEDVPGSAAWVGDLRERDGVLDDPPVLPTDAPQRRLLPGVVPGDALALDAGQADRRHPFQFSTGVRDVHDVNLGKVVARQVETSVRSPRSPGVAHELEPVEDLLGNCPGLD